MISTMSVTSIAPPAHLQLQSQLVCLPAEIKHIIFRLCFTADDVIVDPTICNPVHSKPIPSLGATLLQTCRRLYYEADRRRLFSQNTFRFTTGNRARVFLKGLDDHHRLSVQDVEIDIRRVHSDDSDLAREWLHYLDWESLGSLHMDAPELKTLRLNFESWPRIPMFRIELWNLLRQMLSNVRGLERVVVIGASKGQAMARRDPWSPAHYVGADDIGFNDLIPRMSKCIEAPVGAKFIKWTRSNGKLNLEVVSGAHLFRSVGCDWIEPSVPISDLEPWPVNGCCSLFDYENRRSIIRDPKTKGFNPSAAE
jgi:hypothetical protein